MVDTQKGGMVIYLPAEAFVCLSAELEDERAEPLWVFADEGSA